MQIDLELYRESALIAPQVTISVIDITPQRPQNTLVFLHGFGGNAAQWRHQLEAFAEHDRVLAPDLRGHGQSSRPAAAYDVPRLVADLDAVLDERGVEEPVVLIGHSFGGAVATEFALAQPHRVSRLVLIATAGEFKLIWLYRIGFRLPDPILATVQPFLRGFVDASVLSLKRMFHTAVKPWRGWDKFPQLTQPVMVVRGERDNVFPQAVFARVAELIPGDDDVNVGASAHMVMIERRDAVNRAIERFLGNHAGDAAPYRSWRSENDATPRTALLAERPWLLHYESGVPHTIDVPELPLTRLLDRATRRFGARPAIIFRGRKLSYRRFALHVHRFSHLLRGLGQAKGDRVMLLLPNVPQFVIAYYAILRSGGVAVMSSPLASEDEIVRQAKNSGAEILVTLESNRELARTLQAQSNIRQVVLARQADYEPWYRRLLHWIDRLARRDGSLPLDHSQQWLPALRRQEPKPLPEQASATDLAVIQYTGGTTARPKGVALTHRNLMANALQTRVWIPSARDGQEAILCVVPFSHVYGMTAGMNAAVSMGAAMILLPQFRLREVLQAIKRQRPSLFPGVPSMYMAINTFPGVRRFDVQSIRACLSGAAPLPIEVKEAFEKLTKGRLVEGYGLSEAGPVTHANPIFGQDKTGSIGLPLPNTEARIVDLRSDIPLVLPPGQLGQLQVRGPQVMAAYWRDEDATRAVLDDEGWLSTNDVARMDDEGYFQIISRRQDMWQADDATPAFPRDVEEVIYELPEVREVVVVAIGNFPIAFVQLKEGASLPTKTVLAFARRRLPEGQVPRLIIFVKEFPRSFIGKVLRRQLVSQYAQEITARAGTVAEHLEGLEE